MLKQLTLKCDLGSRADERIGERKENVMHNVHIPPIHIQSVMYLKALKGGRRMENL